MRPVCSWRALPTLSDRCTLWLYDYRPFAGRSAGCHARLHSRCRRPSSIVFAQMGRRVAHQGVQPVWYTEGRLTKTVALGYVLFTGSVGVIVTSRSFLKVWPSTPAKQCVSAHVWGW